MPANFSEWRESLDIFGKYMRPEQDPMTHASHDELCAGPMVDEVTAEDRTRLDELGWIEAAEGHFFTFI